MRISVRDFVLGFVLVCLAAVSGHPQEKSKANEPSLGEIAREMRAQKAKEPKAVMVITNDNIPGSKESGSGFGAGSPGKGTTDADSAKPGSPVQGHDEKYYRSRLSTLQSQLDTHKRELDVLQQKLGQNQMQYYPNPQDSLMQQYTRSDIDKRTADIDAKKQQIADDEKAIQDLHDQLRHEGGDPGWLR